MTQPALFDANTTTDQHCPLPGCQAIKWAGTDKTLTCAHDLDREKRQTRPKMCLNKTDPQYQNIPY